MSNSASPTGGDPERGLKFAVEQLIALCESPDGMFEAVRDGDLELQLTIVQEMLEATENSVKDDAAKAAVRIHRVDFLQVAGLVRIIQSMESKGGDNVSIWDLAAAWTQGWRQLYDYLTRLKEFADGMVSARGDTVEYRHTRTPMVTARLPQGWESEGRSSESA